MTNSIEQKQEYARQISKIMKEKVFQFAHEGVHTWFYNDCTVVRGSYNGPEDQHDVAMDTDSARTFAKHSIFNRGGGVHIDITHDDDLDITDIYFVIHEGDTPPDRCARW